MSCTVQYRYKYCKQGIKIYDCLLLYFLRRRGARAIASTHCTVLSSMIRYCKVRTYKNYIDRQPSVFYNRTLLGRNYNVGFYKCKYWLYATNHISYYSQLGHFGKISVSKIMTKISVFVPSRCLMPWRLREIVK